MANGNASMQRCHQGVPVEAQYSADGRARRLKSEDAAFTAGSCRHRAIQAGALSLAMHRPMEISTRWRCYQPMKLDAEGKKSAVVLVEL